jgi:1-acyl-sn-glycerol-3-phosphate acyltransferase
VPKYIVFSKLSAAGCKAVKDGPEQMAILAADVAAAGGRIIEQYALLGPHDFCTVVEVRDNDAAQLVELAQRDAADVEHNVIPAIDLQLFARLLGQSTENTGPYRWQIGLPARAVRRLFRRYAYTGVANKYFTPLRVLGDEHVRDLKGPAVFIANHTSFMDGPAMYAALPKRYQRRIAWPAAADRFFIKGRRDIRKQGWWQSLVYNSFPLQRGGGRAALSHADWLLDKGWSIAIFPEGARTSAAKLARFRMGPALLAVSHDVPVVPLYLEGLGAIRAKGSREMKPGPVTVRIGPPVRFPKDTEVADATRQLHRAVSALGEQAAEERRAARAAVVDLDAPAADASPRPVSV